MREERPDQGTAEARSPAWVRWIDERQQRYAVTAFPIAVLKKFGDDRGGQLTAAITFSAFLSFFPLVLVIVTVTSFLSQRFAAVADGLRTSALAQFPVVGTELTSGDHALPGSGFGLGVGLAGLVWGGLRVTSALQDAFQDIWHVPFRSRPSLPRRLLRGVAIFGALGIGVVASASLAALGSIVRRSLLAGVLGVAGAFAVSFSLYLVTFWFLSPRRLRIVDLVPGALFAAAGWQTLQQVGIRLVAHQLRRSSELYGAVGAALGLIWFLSVSTQLLLIGLEISSVRAEHLWPRSLMGPRLETADVSVLAGKAHQEERRDDEHIDVRFDGS